MKKAFIVLSLLLTSATSFAGQVYCSTVQFKSKAAEQLEYKKMKGFTKLRLSDLDGGNVRLQLLDMDRSVSLTRKLTKITPTVATDDQLTAKLTYTKQGELEVEITRYKSGDLFLRAIGCQQ